MTYCSHFNRHGTKSVCYGTKEMEECSCNGDERSCDYYPEKRNAVNDGACGFCAKFDFGSAKVQIDKYGARIAMASCYNEYPIDEQFNYCPVCGRFLKQGLSKDVFVKAGFSENIAKDMFDLCRETGLPAESVIAIYRREFEEFDKWAKSRN